MQRWRRGKLRHHFDQKIRGLNLCPAGVWHGDSHTDSQAAATEPQGPQTNLLGSCCSSGKSLSTGCSSNWWREAFCWEQESDLMLSLFYPLYFLVYLQKTVYVGGERSKTTESKSMYAYTCMTNKADSEWQNEAMGRFILHIQICKTHNHPISPRSLIKKPFCCFHPLWNTAMNLNSTWMWSISRELLHNPSTDEDCVLGLKASERSLKLSATNESCVFYSLPL